MIQNLIFETILLKILFLAYNFFIFNHMFQRASSKFFFDFRFSRQKSQSQQKLLTKITYFAIQVRSKHLIILRTSTHLTLKIICSQNTAKNLSDFTNFSGNMFLFGDKKTFALHHFLTPKNCILEEL